MSNRQLLLIVSILCFSCKREIKNVVPFEKEETQISELYDIADQFDYEKIKGQEYLAMAHKNGNFYIIREKDTIFKNSELYKYFHFIDLDGDGNSDIQFDAINYNIPNAHDILLFDANKKRFRFIEEFVKYPDTMKVGNSKYISSYHRNGCSGGSWDSDLFYINNFEIYKIANMVYNCTEDFVTVKKLAKGKPFNSKKIKIENFQGEKMRQKINKYWENNYTEFE